MSLIIHFKKWPFKISSLFNNFISARLFSYCSSVLETDIFYTVLLEKSGTKSHLNEIHAQLFTHQLHENGFIITKFIRMCSNIGEIDYARQVFDEFPDQYIFLWNAIIGGYSRNNMFDEVIEMYYRMRHAFVIPDAFTFPHVVKACGSIRALGYGRAVHAQICRLGFGDDSVVQNGLLSFYSKCKENDCARVIFYQLSDRNVVSWTSIISGYAHDGLPMEALRVFRDMRGSGVKPDWIALVSALKAYSDVEELNQGKCIHGFAVKIGVEFEVDLIIALTSLYAKCGQVMVAKMLFDQIETDNMILWNAMISGFAKNGYGNEALNLFIDMVSRNIALDVVTVQSSILACAHLGSLEQARWMNEYVCNSKFKYDIVVRTSLIDMYAKCGSLESAREVFDSSVEKDVVLWSSMIMGYALHGRGGEAMDVFNEMKSAGIRPNDVTFLSLITACSHSGLVQEGWEYFLEMKDYGLNPSQKHYASIVDMLGRAGKLDKAYEVITSMSIEPSISVWGALLNACEMHGNISLGEYAAAKLFSIDPLNTGHYVQLSNLYASFETWNSVTNVRQLMKSKRLSKDLGQSIVEIDGKLDALRKTKSEDSKEESESIIYT